MEIIVTGIEEVSAEMLAAIVDGVAHGMEKIGERGVGLVVEGTPVGATGNLAHTVFPHLEQNADVMTEVITNGPPADVYSAPVDLGSRPHFPPVDALIPWVIKKFGATDEQTARQIAFAIARKIARRGTQGAFMYEQALAILQEEAAEIMEVEIAEACAAAGF
jgi:hypothetical protein